jgi:hypothetical protein
MNLKRIFESVLKEYDENGFVHHEGEMSKEEIIKSMGFEKLQNLIRLIRSYQSNLENEIIEKGLLNGAQISIGLGDEWGNEVLEPIDIEDPNGVARIAKNI